MEIPKKKPIIHFEKGTGFRIDPFQKGKTKGANEMHDQFTKAIVERLKDIQDLPDALEGYSPCVRLSFSISALIQELEGCNVE